MSPPIMLPSIMYPQIMEHKWSIRIALAAFPQQYSKSRQLINLSKMVWPLKATGKIRIRIKGEN